MTKHRSFYNWYNSFTFRFLWLINAFYFHFLNDFLGFAFLPSVVMNIAFGHNDNYSLQSGTFFVKFQHLGKYCSCF